MTTTAIDIHTLVEIAQSRLDKQEKDRLATVQPMSRAQRLEGLKGHLAALKRGGAALDETMGVMEQIHALETTTVSDVDMTRRMDPLPQHA